jgi:hypothetical protein
MRFHRAEHPVAGTWRLRLSQSGGTATTVDVAAALENSPLRLTAAATDGRLTASFPGGATVTATLRASEQPDRVVPLTATGDGAYSAPLPNLPAGEWMASFEARKGGDVRYAGALVGVAPDAGGGSGGGSGGDGSGGSGGGETDGGGSGGASGGSSTAGGTTGGASSGAKGTTAGGGTAAGGASGGAKGGGGGAKGAKLTATASPARDRRAPYAFAVRGRLSGAACARAKVTLTLGAAKVVVKTDAKCAFSATVKAKKRGRFTVVVTAGGVTAKIAVRAG